MSEYYETSAPDLRIRTAEEKDSALIFDLIKGLAEYEKMEDEVTATEEMLRETIFEKKRAEVVIAEHKGEPVGYALLACLAKIAAERGCDRLEWWCLQWNEPSIRFYKQMGAKPLDEWAIYRVDGEALPALAARL